MKVSSEKWLQDKQSMRFHSSRLYVLSQHKNYSDRPTWVWSKKLAMKYTISLHEAGYNTGKKGSFWFVLGTEIN